MHSDPIASRQTAERLREQALNRLNADFAPENLAADLAGQQPADSTADQVHANAENAAPNDLIPDGYSETFLPSKKSQLGKTRGIFWLTMLAVIAFTAFSGGKTTPGSLGITLGITLTIAISIDWYLRRQLSGEDAYVRLDRQGIESPLFRGKDKRLDWPEIDGITLEASQGVRQLQFQLGEAPGRKNQRDFWTGTNATRPTIALSGFEPATQEKLFEAVSRCQQQARGNTPDATPQANPLSEERLFQEKLKSFTPTPWVTWLLVAANVLIWGLTLLNGAGILKTPSEQLLLWGGNAASEVQRGEWWRLLSSTFMHNGVMHLFMNMLGLASIGITVERIYGHRLFLLIYLGSGLTGSVLSLFFAAQQAVSVGASGAVFGIAGALLVGVYQHRQQLPASFSKPTLSGIGFFVCYSLLQGFTHPGIDNAAHIGGLLGGCLLAFVLPERFDSEHFARSFRQRVLVALAIITVATTGLASMAPPAAVDMHRLFASNAVTMRGLQGFDAAMQALKAEQENLRAGKLTEREADDRSRSVFAPMFEKVLQDLKQAYLPPNDPRRPLIETSTRITELLHESLAMQSIYPEDGGKPQPADPARMAEIEKELGEVTQRFASQLEEAKKKGKSAAK